MTMMAMAMGAGRRVSLAPAPAPAPAPAAAAVLFSLLFLLATTALFAVAAPASLPPHRELRVVLVWDTVNPHSLTPQELTEGPDIKAALDAMGTAGVLNISSGGVLAYPSGSVGATAGALAEIANTADVLIYFAHQAADDQAGLVAATEALLARGGGVVLFHHGVYAASGKAPMLQLLGATASSISWRPTAGQKVMCLNSNAFLCSNGVNFTAVELWQGNPVTSFTNVPDELYPLMTFTTLSGGDTRTDIFVSDSPPYSPAGMVIGYELQRSTWGGGRVVYFQPGEYAPNTLVDGTQNFQILLNSILRAPASYAIPTSNITGGSAPSTTGSNSGTTTTSGGATSGSTSGTTTTSASGPSLTTSGASTSGTASGATGAAPATTAAIDSSAQSLRTLQIVGPFLAFTGPALLG